MLLSSLALSLLLLSLCLKGTGGDIVVVVDAFVVFILGVLLVKKRQLGGECNDDGPPVVAASVVRLRPLGEQPSY